VEIRVSEPPEIRSALEEEIRRELAAGARRPATVHVLSAYKQGYSWIVDVLLPRLRELPVAAIDFTYHTLEESEEIRWQTIAAETRWLQEVYPFDAILARELGISDTAVVFHPTRRKDPIYTFEAKDSTGAVILRETFDPRYVVRPFFDLFPEYEQVRVTTGWVTAVAGGTRWWTGGWPRTRSGSGTGSRPRPSRRSSPTSWTSRMGIPPATTPPSSTSSGWISA
jgi:hypothetical protein